MISLVEALNFRCLRYISQDLGPFHVLVGPNASGKTTFLDVISFLGDLVSDGLDSAIEKRTSNLEDLLWGRKGDKFELAIELSIPERNNTNNKSQRYDTIRYEVAISRSNDCEDNFISFEREILKIQDKDLPCVEQLTIFPMGQEIPSTIQETRRKHSKVVITKTAGGTDNYYPEIPAKWKPAFKLGPRKSALGNLPEDVSLFPISTWLKETLATGIEKLTLNSQFIRKASPPGQGRGFKADGSNLPWVIDRLFRNHRERFDDWIKHLRTALPDLETIKTVERPDDKHRYLVLKYKDGLEVPSWTASDGTLRLLALTLPAYYPEIKGIYLIEEPENGIHPLAVETMFQSLSSTYDAQILMATHSPVILSLVKVEDVLCFAKTPEGATDIVRGDRHPALKDWKGECNLADLFAAGVLG